jgi:hypothetical protein
MLSLHIASLATKNSRIIKAGAVIAPAFFVCVKKNNYQKPYFCCFKTM